MGRSEKRDLNEDVPRRSADSFVLRLGRRLRFPAMAAAALVALSGLILQLGPRDAWRPAAQFFYALPLPVIAGGFVAAGLLGRRLGWRILCFVVALGAVSWWISRSWQWDRGESSSVGGQDEPAAFKLMYWNIARPAHPQDFLLRQLAERDPDIALIGETGRFEESDVKAYASRLAGQGYQVIDLPAGTAVFTKVPMVFEEYFYFSERNHIFRLTATIGGRQVRILLVDLDPGWRSRRQVTFEKLLEEARGFPGPVILAGDFNTPYESVYCDRLREAGLVNAFDETGSGFRETWPLGIPLLSLDQVWHNGEVAVTSHVKTYDLPRDHGLLMTTFRKVGTAE